VTKKFVYHGESAFCGHSFVASIAREQSTKKGKRVVSLLQGSDSR